MGVLYPHDPEYPKRKSKRSPASVGAESYFMSATTPPNASRNQTRPACTCRLATCFKRQYQDSVLRGAEAEKVID